MLIYSLRQEKSQSIEKNIGLGSGYLKEESKGRHVGNNGCWASSVPTAGLLWISKYFPIMHPRRENRTYLKPNKYSSVLPSLVQRPCYQGYQWQIWLRLLPIWEGLGGMQGRALPWCAVLPWLLHPPSESHVLSLDRSFLPSCHLVLPVLQL